MLDPETPQKVLSEYLNHKRRKLNIGMVMLIECIGYPEQIPDDLLNFINTISEASEVKAVAFKSLQQLQALSPNDIAKYFKPDGSIANSSLLHNNLFIFWLFSQSGFGCSLEKVAQDVNLVSNKIRFLQFIFKHC